MRSRFLALGISVASCLLALACQLASAEQPDPTNVPGTNHQISLRVSILEVSLTKLQKIGIDLKPTPAQVGIMGSRELAELQQNLDKAAAKVSPASAIDDPTSFVDSLLQNRSAKVVTRQHLVVTNARPASFRSGEDAPALVPTDSKPGEGRPTIGTDLNFVATERGNGILRIDLRVRIARRINAGTTAGQDSKVPPLNVRQVATSVETKHGCPFALVGLTEDRVEAVAAGAGKTSEVANQVALMVVVLPEPVDPVGDRAIPQPTK